MGTGAICTAQYSAFDIGQNKDKCRVKYFPLPDCENRNFGFAAVGESGDKLIKELVSALKIRPHTLDIGSQISSNEYELTIKQYFKDTVIFLAGSVNDPNFWKARDLILSNSPEFLWLIGFYSEREPLIQKITISNRETASLFHRSDNDLLKATELVRTIHNMFSTASLIGFDFVDLGNIVRGKFSKGLSFECDLDSYGLPYGNLIDFQVFMNRLSFESTDWQGAFLAMFYKSDADWKLSDLNEAISIISRSARQDIDMAFSCNRNTVSSAEFRAYIITPIQDV